MARKPRLEVDGGLYHLITRGVDRRAIFHDERDYEQLIGLLSDQKGRLPFYLYAFCLMTNHIHLLIERRTDDVGRIMHRVLTGYKKRTGSGLVSYHSARGLYHISMGAGTTALSLIQLDEEAGSYFVTKTIALGTRQRLLLPVLLASSALDLKGKR